MPDAEQPSAEEAAVADAARVALAERIERRRSDPDFQRRLQLAIERRRDALDLLAE
jgi:hypothetical protein